MPRAKIYIEEYVGFFGQKDEERRLLLMEMYKNWWKLFQSELKAEISAN